MSLGKGTVIVGLCATIVVVASAAGGAILAANMSSNNILSTTKPEEKSKLNGWQEKNGEWYYYKDDVTQTGWAQDNNNWFYLDNSGRMKLNWLQYKNKWYYLGSDGKMRTGWIQDQDKWYYLNNDGTMATNMTVDGCYLNENGIIADTPSKKAEIEIVQSDKQNTALSYRDAIATAINYAIRPYSYVTSVTFEKGTASYGEETFNLLIPRKANDGSKYVLFSNMPFKNINPAAPSDDIVAYATLRSDGVYEVRGQFLSSFSGNAVGGSFISRTSQHYKDDSSILVYPDGQVKIDGVVCKTLW